jgi:hypothetical protein
MKNIFSCRRTFLATLGIFCLTGLGLYTGADIGGIAIAITGIVGAVAGSNAFEKKSKP